MSVFTTSDGVDIHYKSQGNGRAILFSHGWPLSGDAWETQMLFFGIRGFRAIAYDRRSHGRSQQVWEGNEIERTAKDLAELMDHLDLRNVVLVGHAAGGGEAARYIRRHGCGRLAAVVLVAAVPPMMLRSADNPEGLPQEIFDSIRAGIAANRSQFFRDFAVPFYGHNRPGVTVMPGLEDALWLQAMSGGLKGIYDGVGAFGEVDFTDDLKAITVPVLILHGDDDQIVPIKASALRAVRLIPQATLKIYPGGPHGLAETHPEQFGRDLLSFIHGLAP
ncbi:alpha/beta hydrolase [Paracoccus sp. MBLB3053]|uniref:Alpha/beta hydrolase n=1 Tax=Paracoccus aurantius TaxID=3073814 RepID=A0ABU2HV10_9RHOB|nr:alpha/beta hydrolase [Paracoccus sp. MBLB3053]MDS9468882.1 alpha/beta hydrolase [Paracoccus sp. MBLB3053]